jgi:pyruvate/2-oxoglutarate dehydrogenase complex dihydrolipoamide acyltransferase (E2) component
MPFRKATLEEWFVQHQLEAIRARHFILPMSAWIDVSRIEEEYRKNGENPHYTALILKALAMTAQRHPEINRVAFPNGILELNHISVNLPIVLKRGDRTILTATVLRNIDRLSLGEIRAKIREEKSRDPLSLPVTGFLFRRSNTFLNRFYLRLIHWAAYRFPSLYEKKGGGLSFSSLLLAGDPATAVLPISHGPTAFSLCASSITDGPKGTKQLLLGMTFDHFALDGIKATQALNTLSKILSGENAEDFVRLLT